MKYVSPLLLIIYILTGGYDVFCAETGRKRILKPVLMPVLLLYYLSAAEKPDWLIAAALVCGWLGDVILLRKRNRDIAAGMVTFLTGHLLYAVHLFKIPPFSPEIPAVFLVYGAYLVIVIPRLHQIVPAKMKIPTAVYACVIIFFSLTAFLHFEYYLDIPAFLVWLGSLLFVISDTILAFAVFGKKPEHFVMFTYLCAQLLIVLGCI